MQSRFLQAEEDRVNPIESSQAAFGQTAQRAAGWFVDERNSELKLLLDAAFENAKDVARLADRKAGERFDVGKNPVQPGFFRGDRFSADKPQRCAVLTVSLAEAIIFVRDTAVVIKRSAPEHGAVVHHAVM